MKTITDGMLIPWGFSKHREYLLSGGHKERLVLCIRLPLFWKDRCWMTKRIQWGSAVLRVRFFDDCRIVWVPFRG